MVLEISIFINGQEEWVGKKFEIVCIDLLNIDSLEVRKIFYKMYFIKSIFEYRLLKFLNQFFVFKGLKDILNKVNC